MLKIINTVWTDVLWLAIQTQWNVLLTVSCLSTEQIG